MNSFFIENIIKEFNWDIITSMYGNSHSSIIGFLSSEWIKKSSDHSVLDGVPSPFVGKGRKGQKNADILLCKGDKPFIVVEVETLVSKYLEKIDSIVSYIGNIEDYDGISFGLLVMLNYTNGGNKYKHNWHNVKQYAISKDIPIAFVSIEKSKVDLGDTVLDHLKRRNEYYPWEISSIDYWACGSDRKIIEGNLFKRYETFMYEKNGNKDVKIQISNKEIELVINKMGLNKFTVLDFYDYIKDNEKDLLVRLDSAFMNTESKKGYSPLNYISNRLVHYSRQNDSLLGPHVSYEKGKDKCFMKVSEKDKKRFKSDYIAVFKLKD